MVSAGGNTLFTLDSPAYGVLEDKSTQPFQIIVHPQVTLLCDIHSHLSTAEVIGLLAGKWDYGAKFWYIQASFPCGSTQRIDDGALDVELDPVAEYETRNVINDLGLTVVGWYHSHPKFKPNPSTIDIFNQNQYQSLMHDENTNLDPFVGLIVSTYDNKLSTHVSDHQWFHVAKTEDVRSATAGKTVDVPMRLEVDILKLTTAPSPPRTTAIAHEDFINELKEIDKVDEKGVRGVETEIDLSGVNYETKDEKHADKEHKPELIKADIFSKLFCGVCSYVCTCKEHKTEWSKGKATEKDASTGEATRNEYEKGTSTKIEITQATVESTLETVINDNGNGNLGSHNSAELNIGKKSKGDENFTVTSESVSLNPHLKIDYAKVQQEAIETLIIEQTTGLIVRPKRRKEARAV